MAGIAWSKLGMVFAPSGQHEWMATHAANPVAEHLDHDRFRIFFSCRDCRNRSHIGSVDIELGPPVRVLAVADEPWLGPGPLGAFDDSGTSLGCLVKEGSRTLLYYLGWNLGVTVPWRNSIGVAVRESPGCTFVKHSLAPIVDRGASDPFTLSYPWVLKDGSNWKMWYGSSLSWGTDVADLNHVIKYAESADGLNWIRNDAVAVPIRPPEEYAVCRPCVLGDSAGYRMWYAFRTRSYGIGYAESQDGLNWQRLDDEAGITPSASGWDSEMVEYPSVFHHEGRPYLLYCGNAYGKTGFGIAAGSDSR